MIEELARCLEYRGQSMLRGARRNQKNSRRYLHSAFWSHGAGSIKLPAWWVLLLQTPISSEHGSLSTSSRPSKASAMVSGLQNIVLDLLYPVQTLALIRKLKRSTEVHHYAAKTVKRCSRGYASIATELISSTPESQRDAQSQNTVHAAPNPLTFGKSLSNLLDERGTTTSCDVLWQTYQDLLEHSGSLSPAELVKMFRRLVASKSPTDTERLLALFESVPLSERRAVHYSYAIAAALKLGDMDTAFYAHREAMSRLHSPVGASAILHYAVIHEDWKLAIGTWHPLWESGFFYYTRSDIWAGIEEVPLDALFSSALSAVEYALYQCQPAGLPEAMHARKFALELSERAFRVKDVEFHIPSWRSLLIKLGEIDDTHVTPRITAIQMLALEQALSIRLPVYSVAATDIYDQIRPHTTELIYKKSLLEDLLRRCIFPRSLSVAWEILKDYRKKYGRMEIPAYKTLMLRLAKGGQAQHLRETFDLYRADHGTPQDADLYRTLLAVHFRRADPEKASQTFIELQKDYGFIPDLACYNTIIHTYARVGDAEGAWTWFEAIQEADLSPDQSSFFPLMLIYSKRGDRDAVRNLTQRATAQGLKLNMPMVDLQVLACTNDNRMDEAESLLDEALGMELEGARTRMWNMVLNAYALQKNLPKVQELYRLMREANIPADSMTFAALIGALSASKFPAAAYKVLRKVMPKLDLKPTVLHYASVMMGYQGTAEYEAVFRVYRTMLEQGLLPDISTQNVLLRAAAAMDERGRSEAKETAHYTLASQILEQTVARLDPSELATLEPRKFVGPNRLDEAFTSTYFEYMIFLHGASGAFKQVSEAYDTYIKTARTFSGRNMELSPPMRMLSALLVAHKHAGNTEEVDRCWYLALDKCEILARKASVKDLSQQDWVLPARRYIINLPFEHYLSHLGEQKRFEDLINVVNDLHHDGYELNHRNWNTYIQFLSGSDLDKHKLLAFMLCETHLMPQWAGWEAMGHPARMKNRFKGMAKEIMKDAGSAAPTYLTFVWLTKAYVDLGFGRARRRAAGTQEMLESGKLAKTLDAVSNMPMLDDWEQRTILGRGPYSEQDRLRAV